MKKIISFSLYNNKPCYQLGAITNTLEAKRLFPDWKCRFYTTDPTNIRNQLTYLGAEVVDMSKWKHGYMFWRFLAVDDADAVMVRDADSVVSEREVVVINQWLASDCQWHIIRDHPAHRSVPIPGGMWGYRKLPCHPRKLSFENDNSFFAHIGWWQQETRKSFTKVQHDQHFLKWMYEKYIKNFPEDILRFGPQGIRIPLHKPTRYTRFVGERTFNHGSVFTNLRMLSGYNSQYFNSTNWKWWWQTREK